MRLFRPFLLVAALPLLGACVDDRTAWEGDGSQILTIVREQKWFWDESVEVSVVVARMPDCMRWHRLGTFSPQTRVELWQYRADTYVLKVGDRLFATETRTCEGLEKLKEPPPGGLGEAVGVFAEKDGRLAFNADKATKAGAQ